MDKLLNSFTTDPVFTVASFFTVGLVTLLGFQYFKDRSVNPNRLPLPPGPKPLPIIGNIRDFPETKPWLKFRDMSQKYGDLIYLSLFGQPMIVITSSEVATDLLEKRSTIYSDKLKQMMLTELMGFSFALTVMPYGEWWRRNRRRFHQYFNADASQGFRPLQLKMARQLLRRLKDNPDDVFQHLRHTLAATIVKLTYGFDLQEKNDPFVNLAQEALGGFSKAGIWGTFYVDILPFLRYIPAWFPGAGFQKFALKYKNLATKMKTEPFDAVQEALDNGTAVPSVTASMIENLPTGPERIEELEIARNTASMAYGAGADTTTSTAQTFILAMLLYPEVQKKAQAELDAVVGPGRLPEFEDRPNLPYIDAVLKESLRWQLVTPIVIHVTTESDEYKGYYIPKNSVLLINCWNLLHNPEEWKDPEEFIPERFLKDGKIDPTVRDPEFGAFGFGRRICPGRYTAQNSLFSVISSVLHTFDITPALDANGKPIHVKPEMTTGVISQPESFPCSIKPRSAAAEALINEAQLDL